MPHHDEFSSKRTSRPADGNWQGLLQSGLAHLKSGNPRAALPILRNAACLAPGDFNTRMALAAALLRQGEAPAALSEFREARRIDPSRSSPYHGIGLALHALNDLTAALDAFRRAVSEDPLAFRSWGSIADITEDECERVNAVEGVADALMVLLGAVSEMTSPFLERGLDPEKYLPDWVREPAGLPPMKAAQVASLTHMYQVREQFSRPWTRHMVHPLISQPLIELCLRLPAWQLTAGGQERGLARQALTEAIPPAIRARATKGSSSQFFTAHLFANRPQILAALRDGHLVSSGYLDPAELEGFASGAPYLARRASRRMMTAYMVEAWLRAWQG
jgi:Tfp pilus assembly protein PilF